MSERILAALAIAFFALVLALIAINFLGRNDRLETDEIALSPACAPRVNPCATMRCEVKIDNRRYT